MVVVFEARGGKVYVCVSAFALTELKYRRIAAFTLTELRDKRQTVKSMEFRQAGQRCVRRSGVASNGRG